MKNGKVEKILIVGGGSAGWMTAAILSKLLPDVRVSLVESSDIPTIGVGEATIAHISKFFHLLGLKEADWMPPCNASYKYTIQYRNWHAMGDEYYHPFEPLIYHKSPFHLASFWWYDRYKRNPNKDRSTLYTDCFLSVDALKANRIFRKPGTPEFSDNVQIKVGAEPVNIRIGYAYHFDAGLMGEFLKTRVAKPAGVEQILDEVVNVRLTENGAIAALETKRGQTLSADLYVDCSGFQALLIEKTLKEPFISFSKTLFCDRAVAMQVPYVDKRTEMHPYTRATALTAGWIWTIPLASRIGTGYVYSSAFGDETAAETKFRDYWDTERVKDLSARHIKIRVGRHRRAWVKNCVAIGLSSGFIEPLESTGLQFILQGAERLAHALGTRHYNAGEVGGYNHFFAAMLEEARDFLSIHYALTSREDTAFWQAAKYDTEIPDAVKELLSQARFRFPNDRNGYTFGNNSWVCILNGMNFVPSPDPLLTIPDHQLAPQLQLMGTFRDIQPAIRDKLPLHCDYLARLYESAGIRPTKS